MTLKREDFLILTITSSLLLPPFMEIGGISLRLDDFLLLIIAPIYCLFKATIPKKSPLWIFLLFFLSALISTFAGYIFRSVPPSIGDLNEFIRMLKYAFAIIIASSIDYSYFYEKYDRLMYYGSIFIILLSIIEYTNIGGIGETIGLLYSAPHHIENMIAGARRIVVTGGDPNIGGFITAFFFAYHYLLSISIRKQKHIILILLLAICIIATASRTVFLGVATVSILPVFLSKHIPFPIKLSSIALISLGLVWVFSSNQFAYLTLGIEEFYKGESQSLNIRYQMWTEPIRLFQQSYLIGWGPAKAIHKTIVDGEYVFLLVRYGLIGTFLFLLIMLRNLSNYVKRNNLHTTYVFYLTIVGLFFMLTNSLLTGYQLFAPFIILTTIAWKQSITISNSIDNV